MRKYIFIGTGGTAGAILRYVIKNMRIYHYREQIPINTLIINLSGSFLLALILTVAFEVWELDAEIRLGIATGFLGAYTTFSTLCKETVSLFNQGMYYSAVSYIGFSTMLGLFFVYLGSVAARELIPKLIKDKFEDIPEIDMIRGVEETDDGGRDK
ncbi:MAG: fluoride efflux transporter CrcB [Bacillota bacterium]|nr:fluoride efflux transporter CrcB [Bacillota bacterium]